MRSIALAAILSIFLVGSARAESVYAIKFESMSVLAEMKVKFVDLSILADEKWYVAGKCENAVSATKIKVVIFSSLADKKVKLESMSFAADKKICITNIGDAPKEFWDAYK